jgi:hypothetical protein
MEPARQALKKLNIFAQIRHKDRGNALFSKAASTPWVMESSASP